MVSFFLFFLFFLFVFMLHIYQNTFSLVGWKRREKNACVGTSLSATPTFPCLVGPFPLPSVLYYHRHAHTAGTKCFQSGFMGLIRTLWKWRFMMQNFTEKNKNFWSVREETRLTVWPLMLRLCDSGEEGGATATSQRKATCKDRLPTFRKQRGCRECFFPSSRRCFYDLNTPTAAARDQRQPTRGKCGAELTEGNDIPPAVVEGFMLWLGKNGWKTSLFPHLVPVSECDAAEKR